MGEQLVFFPPDTDEDYEEIRPFIKELPILMSALLEGDERNDIEGFLRSLGVRVLYPEQMIREWIIPQYSQSDNPKPSVEKIACIYATFSRFGTIFRAQNVAA